MSDNEIMNIKEVAQYLAVNEQTVYRLVQNEKLPAVKIGGQWKIKKSHIDHLFDEMFEKVKQSNAAKLDELL